MKSLSVVQEISNIGKPKKIKQAQINTGEVFEMWDLLEARYDVIYTTQILQNNVRDDDLKIVITEGLKTLKKQAGELEKLIAEYGIPLPKKPPDDVTETTRLESITDEYIFRRIFRGIQSFLPIHMSAIIKSSSPKIRENFRRYLNEEIDIYDKLYEYGKFKNFLDSPPVYRV